MLAASHSLIGAVTSCDVTGVESLSLRQPDKGGASRRCGTRISEGYPERAIIDAFSPDRTAAAASDGWVARLCSVAGGIRTTIPTRTKAATVCANVRSRSRAVAHRLSRM